MEVKIFILIITALGMLTFTFAILLCIYSEKRISAAVKTDLGDLSAETHRALYGTQHNALSLLKIQQAVFALTGILILGGIYWLLVPRGYGAYFYLNGGYRLTLGCVLTTTVYLIVSGMLFVNDNKQRETRIGLLKHRFKDANKDIDLRRVALYWMDDREYETYTEKVKRPMPDRYTWLQVGLLFASAIAVNVKFAFLS